MTLLSLALWGDCKCPSFSCLSVFKPQVTRSFVFLLHKLYMHGIFVWCLHKSTLRSKETSNRLLIIILRLEGITTIIFTFSCQCEPKISKVVEVGCCNNLVQKNDTVLHCVYVISILWANSESIIEKNSCVLQIPQHHSNQRTTSAQIPSGSRNCEQETA